MKRLFFAALLFALCACQNSEQKQGEGGENLVDASGESIRARIEAPPGFEWEEEASGSFGEFLQQTKLKASGSQILDFRGEPIGNQAEHVAVLDYDVGNKDLQQCADAAIRLRAEYLRQADRSDEIGFHFTSGDFFKWSDYKNGIRPQVVGNSVSFSQTASPDDSYEAFRRYLNIVFMYAGTISVNRETRQVRSDEDIKTGDIIITPGSPGHVVIIVGRAKNSSGERVYLLAQGYTPAQSIHVITNPFEGGLNPWYRLSVSQSSVSTARYTFGQTNIRSYE